MFTPSLDYSFAERVCVGWSGGAFCFQNCDLSRCGGWTAPCFAVCLIIVLHLCTSCLCGRDVSTLQCAVIFVVRHRYRVLCTLCLCVTLYPCCVCDFVVSRWHSSSLWPHTAV